MSNIWLYKVLISPRSALSESDSSKIIKSITGVGYSSENPITGRVLVTRVNPVSMEEQSNEFDNLRDAIPDLAKAGTLLQLWKGDKNIALEFDLTGETYASVVRTLKIQDTPFFGEISISVDNTWFRADGSERISVAQDVLQLFTNLSLDLGAKAGYSSDEDMLENYLPHLHIHNDVSTQRAPSILFWLNYFPSGYVERIGLDVFIHMNALITDLPNGKLISFFRYPWNVKLTELQLINTRWRQLRT